MNVNVFRSKTKPLLGLDIGAKAIKAVLLEPVGNDFTVIGIAYESLHENIMNERRITHFDAVIAGLTKIKRQLSLKSAHVAIAVSGPHVFSKTVAMPDDLLDTELEALIQTEASSLLPLPLDEVYLDFEVVGKHQHYPGKVDVLITTAQRELVDDRTTLLREMHWRPAIVDTEYNALGNLLSRNHSAQENAAICFHMGAAATMCIVVKDGVVVHSKEIKFGLSDLLSDIALALQISEAEVSDKIMRKLISSVQIESVYSLFINLCQQHMQRAIQLAMQQLDLSRSPAVSISGGISALPNISALLSQELDCQVSHFNPITSLATELNSQCQLTREELLHNGPIYNLALGLSMRSINPWHR